MKHLLAGITACAALTAAASADSITTLFNSNNGGAGDWTVFFEVEVLNPEGLTFNQIDVNARNGEGNPIGLEVYVREGSADLSNSGGPTASAAGWDLVATGDATAGPNDVPTEIRLNDTFTLEPGSWAVGIRTLGVGQNYTNGDGTNQFFSNDDLELTLGNSRSGTGGFGGTHFYPRVWNGTLYYEPADVCIADWNGDGEVDINDFFAYLDDFEAGDPRADLNNDGEIDINDFFIFLSEFEAGC